MKRELKDDRIIRIPGLILVTRHIPMKRELKVFFAPHLPHNIIRHKAYPDEKGTESEYPGRGRHRGDKSQGISR